jgi:uncharacterized protein
MTARHTAGTAVVRWHGESFVMLPERALFWKRGRMLIIADPHFGKAAAFRARGVPVPSGTTAANLERLACALATTGAARLLVLGDFFHAAAGRAPDTLARIAAWRAAHAALEIVLVLGNHDIAAGSPPADWRIRQVHEHREVPFRFRHDAEDDGDATPCLAGHVHPAVMLEDASGATLRVPVFLFGRTQALLPAFGDFTGTARVKPRRGDRIFAVGQDVVVEVGAAAPLRRVRGGDRQV